MFAIIILYTVSPDDNTTIALKSVVLYTVSADNNVTIPLKYISDMNPPKCRKEDFNPRDVSPLMFW